MPILDTHIALFSEQLTCQSLYISMWGSALYLLPQNPLLCALFSQSLLMVICPVSSLLLL